MRRRDLIDQYLRAHDPVAGGEALRADRSGGAGADPRRAAPEHGDANAARAAAAVDDLRSPRRSRPARRRPWILAPAALVAGAAAVVVALASVPSNAPSPARFLSPDEALAAAAAGLEHDGILEWTDVQGGLGTDLAAQGTKHIRWVDLKTGDHSGAQEERFIRGYRPGVPTMSSWSVGRESWLDEGQRSKTTGKRIVRHTVVDRPPRSGGAETTPVAKFRRTLDRALRGDLPYRAAGEIDGVPVVEITDARKTYTSRSWITRERTPRLVKAAYTMPCAPVPGMGIGKVDCSAVSDDGSPGGGMTSVTRTLVWKIHPRTAELLAKVHPPAFDPAKYQVITEHRR